MPIYRSVDRVNEFLRYAITVGFLADWMAAADDRIFIRTIRGLKLDIDLLGDLLALLIQ